MLADDLDGAFGRESDDLPLTPRCNCNTCCNTICNKPRCNSLFDPLSEVSRPPFAFGLPEYEGMADAMQAGDLGDGELVIPSLLAAKTRP
jgi:hypothetical protein